jgi:copper(I)-binding protein
MRSRIAAVCGSLVIMVAVAACSSTGAAAPTIEGAWARPGAAGAETAAYMTIKGQSGQADALMSASSPSAEKVELHEATTDASGMTGMHPIDHLDIHAGEAVELKPGAFHLMVMGLTKDLAVGDKLELELTFEHAGKVTVQAEVKQG